MSPERRRSSEGMWRTATTAVRELPFTVARLFPRHTKGNERRSRNWTRPRRIALGLTALVVVGGGLATWMIVSKGRDPAHEIWRLHDEAVEQFRAGRFDQVVATCRRILEKNPADAVARFNLGAALVRLGEKEQGLHEIRESARDRPNFDDAHLALAEDALARDDEDTAFAELELVVAEPPTPGVAESLVASILRRRGRDADAMPHLRAAAQDALADPVIRIRSAVALGRMHGQRASVPRVASRERQSEVECYSLARQIADEAIARSENGEVKDAGAFRAARAELLLASGKPNEALVDADLALGLTQDETARAELRLLRAQVYAMSGDAPAAADEIAAALGSTAKPSAGAFRSAAAIYSSASDFPRALELLARGAEAHPEDVEIGLARIVLQIGAGDLDAAERECERVVALDPRGTAALLLRGDIRRARGDVEGARTAYAEALGRRPDDVRAKLRLAGTAFDSPGVTAPDAAERLAEAERIAQEVLAGSPRDAGALLALAKVRLAHSPGRDAPEKPDAVNAEARRLLVSAVESDPLSLEARTLLGWAEYLTRNDQQAAVELEQVLAMLPGESPKLRLLLARCLLEGGSHADAAEMARRVAIAVPDDVEGWKVLSVAAFQAGDRDGALDALRHLEALEPSEFRHLFDQAAVLAASGRFAAAEERFAAAEERTQKIEDPGQRADAEFRVAKARSEFYRQRGEIERGRDVYRALLDKGGPKTAAPLVSYARFLLSVGQRDDAEREVERAIALEPANLEARRTLCEIWFSRREASPVLVSQVEEVARVAPKDPLVHYLRGKLATLQGDLRLGKELLGRYVEAAPDDPDGHYALGVTLSSAGEHAEAVKRLEAAGRLLPGSPEVRVALARVRQSWAMELARRGRIVEAQAALRRAVADDPTSRESRAMLVDALRFTGEVELSEKEVRALLYADPDDRAALRMLAAIQSQGGHLDDAVVTLRRLADVAPDDWTAWQFLSAALADKGDLDGAEVAAKAALRAAPDEPGALAAELHVLSQRHDVAGAESVLAAATAKHPEEARYPLYLAMLREQEARHEEAVVAAARALDLRPAMPGALQLAIQALSVGLGDPERAANFARERVAKAKDDVVMAYQLAALEADLGGRDAALEILAPLCDRETPLPAALSLRALLLIEKDEYAAAREALRRGIEAYADAIDLHYLMAQSWLADPSQSKDGEPQEPARGFAVAELRSVLAVVRVHPPALNNLAWLLCRDEATRGEALQCAEAATAAAPGDPNYLDTLGTVQMRIARPDQALATFRRALGLCEEARTRLEGDAGKARSPIETTRNDALRRRLKRVTAEVKTHYDEALRASTGR